MPNTPVIGAPYPAYTAVPDVPAELNTALLHVEKYVIPRFATAAARDTAIPAPITNQYCDVAGVLYRYNGTLWLDVLASTYSESTPTMTGVWSSLAANPISVGKLNNLVTVEGQASTSAAATASTNNNIMTLPVGYRPSSTKAFVAHSSQGQVLLTVTSAGIVGIGSTYAAANVVAGGFIYVDPITFRI
jgi:hypothetical protein